eukprot:TRINITY_DN6192_c0_g1_i1.p2 TRINITY_DN6192_c0_g1~~TRINITY_DN6192_c0_g1_i1.p2  ORF type:complete len:235 (-),score=29.16 TRINITY_DN6192_c0_g1_i1:164-868(-)
MMRSSRSCFARCGRARTCCAGQVCRRWRALVDRIWHERQPFFMPWKLGQTSKEATVRALTSGYNCPQCHAYRKRRIMLNEANKPELFLCATCTTAAVASKTQLAKEFCVSAQTLNGLPSYNQLTARRVLLRYMAFERAVVKYGSEGALRNKMRSKMDDMELPRSPVSFFGFRDSSVSVRFPMDAKWPNNDELLRLAPVLFPLENSAPPPRGVVPITGPEEVSLRGDTNIVCMIH